MKRQTFFATLVSLVIFMATYFLVAVHVSLTLKWQLDNATIREAHGSTQAINDEIIDVARRSKQQKEDIIRTYGLTLGTCNTTIFLVVYFAIRTITGRRKLFVSTSSTRIQPQLRNLE